MANVTMNIEDFKKMEVVDNVEKYQKKGLIATIENSDANLIKISNHLRIPTWEDYTSIDGLATNLYVNGKKTQGYLSASKVVLGGTFNISKSSLESLNLYKSKIRDLRGDYLEVEEDIYATRSKVNTFNMHESNINKFHANYSAINHFDIHGSVVGELHMKNSNVFISVLYNTIFESVADLEGIKSSILWLSGSATPKLVAKSSDIRILEMKGSTIGSANFSNSVVGNAFLGNANIKSLDLRSTEIKEISFEKGSPWINKCTVDEKTTVPSELKKYVGIYKKV